MGLKNMQINGKSALIKEQIEDRVSKGAKSLEIQLLNELQTGKEPDLSLIENVDICAVHMPLFQGNDYNIETIEGKKIFEKVCELSSKIASIKKHNVIVVIHIATPLFLMEQYGIKDDVIKVILKMIKKYNNIKIAIENNVLYDFSPRKGVLYRQNSYYILDNKLQLSSVELAKAVNHKRCGVCFDTCHALMSERHLNNDDRLFEGYISDICHGKRPFDIFFEEAAPMLKLIHLAYADGHGYEKNHSRPFTEREHIVLRYIDNLCDKYNICCPVTIEVYEDDINEADNFVTTKNQIKKL